MCPPVVFGRHVGIIRVIKDTGEVQESKVEWSRSIKKKEKKRWGWVLRLVHYSSAWRHTGMTPGPRAGSGGKGRGEEVKTVRQHNLINLCQTPPQVDQAGE